MRGGLARDSGVVAGVLREDAQRPHRREGNVARLEHHELARRLDDASDVLKRVAGEAGTVGVELGVRSADGPVLVGALVGGENSPVPDVDVRALPEESGPQSRRPGVGALRQSRFDALARVCVERLAGRSEVWDKREEQQRRIAEIEAPAGVVEECPAAVVRV
jgi:hypothetical protein